MPVKHSYRPGYTARRFLHHRRVDFAVWLQNRQVEKAFYDPVIDVGKPSRMAAIGAKPYVPWVGAGIALCLAGAALFLALRHRSDLIPLGEVPAAPAVTEVPQAAPAPAPVAKVAVPEVPAAAAPAAETAPSATTTPTTPAPPATATPTPPAPAPAVASLPAVPEPKVWALPATYDLLLACKRDRTLYVYHRDARGWKKTAAFPMAFGRRNGDKLDAGDGRTPEGLYWINGMVAGPDKGAMYGSLVFTLNYPKPGDQADGKTGEGIWIHGVNAGKQPTYTHGCLSLANDDVLALADHAGPGTPVLILPDQQLPDPASQADEPGMKREYPALMASLKGSLSDSLAVRKAVEKARAFVAKEAKDFPGLAEQGFSPAQKEAVLARLEKWRTDWMARDAAVYGANYASYFRDKEGRNRKAFLDRKKQIFESKQSISMTMEDAQIEPEGYGRVKVSFRQDYEAVGADGTRQHSSDVKTLRLEDGPGGWLIIYE